MDLYSFNINTANEHRLRGHIREVLWPYARTHLTSDHIGFTEKAVEEVSGGEFLTFEAAIQITQLLLQTLEYVPMVDATSFLLPTEPFDILVRSLNSVDFTVPEERWTTSPECIRHLKTFFPPPPRPRDLPTEKCWYEDDHCLYMKLSLNFRPISSPILSNRALRETPKLGNTTSRASIPRTWPVLTAFLDTEPISVETIEDLAVPPIDNVLDLCPKLDTITSTRVRSFLQTTLVPPTRKKYPDDTPNVFDFLNCNSPPRCLPSLDSPPLFPRVSRGRSIHGAVRNDCRATCISDLVSVVPVASPELTDGEDGDIHSHHMQVVNGHSTLSFSSPSPPSACSLDRSEVDELWNISPPVTPATSLVIGKMDEIVIPRTRKFGHKNALVVEGTNGRSPSNLLTATKSPGFFITSFISAPIPITQTLKPITSQQEGIKSGMPSPRPLSPAHSTSHSLIVQPLSILEEQTNEEAPIKCVEDIEKQQFDNIVASIYTSTPQDTLFYVEEETLDEKDIMLMDVPNLPSPTAHPEEPILFPKRIQSIVALKREDCFLGAVGRGSDDFGSTALLAPVKGIKHLALDLSWRPFNFGNSIPTNEQVAEIAKPVQPEDEIPGYRDEKHEKAVCVLFDLTTPMSAEDEQPTLIPKNPRGCQGFGMSPAPKRAEVTGHIEYLLTRRERTRATRAKVTLESEDEVQEGVDEERPDDRHRSTPAQHENSPQRLEYFGLQSAFDTVDHFSQSRVDHGYSFDDSGVDIIDNNNLSQLSASEFGVPLRRHSDVPCIVGTAGGNENDDSRSEDKENIPPRDVSDYQLADYELDPLANQHDWNDYFEFPASEAPSFEPLSFASQSRVVVPSDDVTNSRVQDVPPLTPSDKLLEDDLISAREREQTNSKLSKRRKLDDLVPASSNDLFSTFIGLRNQATSSGTWEHSEIQDDVPTPQQIPHVPEQSPPRVAPCDVVDQHTVRLPERWVPAATVHRYLASMALIQKRALVRKLQGHCCQVLLVERYDLGGTDIVIDPNYGIMFVSLLALPAQLESVVERISGESWRYSNILVIFEAFPSAQSCRADHSQNTRPTPCAYTPPICKAVKKLRRNLSIAEGCGTMDPQCALNWAYANDVEEAAKFVRCFGEEACEVAIQRGNSMIWDEREWLEEEEEREGESDLARVNGMNAFAAFLMLYDRSLETILDLSSESRLVDYGQLLGQERITRLNDVIESRLRQMAATAESVADHGY